MIKINFTGWNDWFPLEVPFANLLHQTQTIIHMDHLCLDPDDHHLQQYFKEWHFCACSFWMDIWYVQELTWVSGCTWLSHGCPRLLCRRWRLWTPDWSYNAQIPHCWGGRLETWSPVPSPGSTLYRSGLEKGNRARL